MAFKLLKVKFEKDDEKALVSSEYINKNISFSIIIGSNGTGKSYFIAQLVEAFRDIMEKIVNNSQNIKSPKYYYIKYELNNTVYAIEKDKNNYTLTDGLDINNIPKSILALTFIPEDKFTYQSEEDNIKNMYKYLGIRNTGNAIFNGSINKKINNIIYNNLDNKEFCNKLISTFEILGYAPELLFSIEYKLTRLVSQNITKQTLNTKLQKLKENSKYLNHRIFKINESDKDSIIKFTKSIKNTKDKNYENNKIFTEFIINFEDTKNIIEKYKIIKMMVDLDLLKVPSIGIRKTNENSSIYGFESLSSGEKNLLFITLNIIDNLSNESLIVIDEPEISLHPNWQIVYNHHLKNILKGYKNIHIAIASHSHFMVSGLEIDEANIYSIDHNKNIELIKSNLYGWSSENILYKVFNARTVNNYYLEAELTNVFSLIADRSNDIEQIISIYNNLKKIAFDKDDPLHEIVNEIKLYIDELE